MVILNGLLQPYLHSANQLSGLLVVGFFVLKMESHGLPGKIQITRETYELIRDEFICEPRGTVAVKGKGEMETWYLTGYRDGEVGATSGPA